jgi:hypothetical protein
LSGWDKSLLLSKAASFPMSKNFSTDQTAKTPHIEMDGVSGEFLIRGKSIPENTVQFYKPFFDWLESYSQAPAAKTALTIQLDYFNTSSAKIFADVFKKLEILQDGKKTEVCVNWKYDEQDDDMLEAGEDYKSISKIPFHLISFAK